MGNAQLSWCWPGSREGRGFFERVVFARWFVLKDGGGEWCFLKLLHGTWLLRLRCCAKESVGTSPVNDACGLDGELDMQVLMRVTEKPAEGVGDCFIQCFASIVEESVVLFTEVFGR